MKMTIKEMFKAVLVEPVALIIIETKSSPAPVLDPLAKEIIKERRIMPMISSRIAALTKAVPTLVSSLPNSFKVATVMETEVAERITP